MHFYFSWCLGTGVASSSFDLQFSHYFEAISSRYQVLYRQTFTVQLHLSKNALYHTRSNFKVLLGAPNTVL